MFIDMYNKHNIPSNNNYLFKISKFVYTLIIFLKHLFYNNNFNSYSRVPLYKYYFYSKF